jgi:hypothetical protein
MVSCCGEWLIDSWFHKWLPKSSSFLDYGQCWIWQQENLEHGSWCCVWKLWKCWWAHY